MSSAKAGGPVRRQPPTKVSQPTNVASSTTSTKVELLPFGKRNYILLCIGIGILAVGYILLGIEKFVDANQFSVSLYIAPVVIIAGYVEIIYAIMAKSSDNKHDSEE